MVVDLQRAVIMVVDTNLEMRRLVRQTLRSHGVGTVVDAADGADALRLMEIHSPDVLITELSMTPIDGLELTRFVRRGKRSPNPYMGVIAVCGHADPHLVCQARDEGVSEFLIRPLSAAVLMSHVSSVLERPRKFVRSATFFGPDRRRHAIAWRGVERRVSGIRPGGTAAPVGVGARATPSASTAVPGTPPDTNS